MSTDGVNDCASIPHYHYCDNVCQASNHKNRMFYQTPCKAKLKRKIRRVRCKTSGLWSATDYAFFFHLRRTQTMPGKWGYVGKVRFICYVHDYPNKAENCTRCGLDFKVAVSERRAYKSYVRESGGREYGFLVVQML